MVMLIVMAIAISMATDIRMAIFQMGKRKVFGTDFFQERKSLKT
jgi:hypothetical protein